MPEYSYKPFPKTDTLPQDKLEEVSLVLKDTLDNFEVKPFHFIPHKNFIFLYCNTTKLAEQVSVKIKERKEKPLPTELPYEIINEIERLKKQHKLNRKQLDKLARLTMKKEIKNLELEKQIEHLKAQAIKFGDDLRLKRIKDRFNNTYNKFFSVLNPDLFELNQFDKEEITTKLESMRGAINDTLDGLK